MKFDIKILWIKDIMNHAKGDVTKVSIDLERVSDHVELLLEIENQIGDFEEGEDFEILDEAQFWTNAQSAATPFANIDSDKIDKIRVVLRKYFDVTSDEYDSNFSAEDAIKEVETIVGDYE